METFGKTRLLKSDVEIILKDETMMFRTAATSFGILTWVSNVVGSLTCKKYLVPCTKPNQTTLSGYVKCAEKEV